MLIAIKICCLLNLSCVIAALATAARGKTHWPEANRLMSIAGLLGAISSILLIMLLT